MRLADARRVAAFSMLLLFAASAQALDPGRLEAMSGAADRLKALAEKSAAAGEDLRPTSPEFAPLLALVCRPDEAEKLADLPLDRLKVATGYVKHVSAVMEIFSDAGDRARSQQTITGYVRDLGACWDATIWGGRAMLAIADRMVAQDPARAKNEQARSHLVRLRTASVLVIEGALESFTLNGIGADWCEARLRPLITTIETASKSMSRAQREDLRKYVGAAERCSPAVKDALQAAHRSLAQ